MTEIINIAVPSQFADEVRRFAAFIAEDRGRSASNLGLDAVPDYPLWADHDVLTLATADTVTARIYRQIMNVILDQEKVGEWVSIAELAEWTEQRVSVISTFRTHLYRYINAHLPEGTLAPFTRANGQDLRPARRREVFYRVGAECAEQWRRIQPKLEAMS